MADFNYEEYGLKPLDLGNQVKSTSTGDDYYDNLTKGQRKKFEAMPEELQDLYRRTPSMQVMDSDNLEATDPNYEIIGGRQAYDVTHQVKDVATADDASYQSIYPDAKDIDRSTQVKAKVADFAQLLFPNMPETQSQAENKKQIAEYDEWLKQAKETYESIGTELDGERVFETWDEVDGELVLVDRVLIPDPESTAFNRIITNTGRNIYGQAGSLLEGKIASEGEFEKGIATFEQSPGEDFVTDIFTFGLPAVGVTKALKGARYVGARYVPQAILNVPGLSRGTAYISNTLGVAFSDAVVATTGDEGLIDHKYAADYLGISEERAKDMTLFLESMAFSGALDTLAAGAGIIGRFGQQRTEGIRAFASKEFVRNKAQQGALLGIINTLDPTIATANSFNQKRKLAAMAEMMNENAFLQINAGDVTGIIPADAATAVLSGAKKYIANTRPDLRKGKSLDEWKQAVEQEAGIMALTMIEIARTKASDPAMIQAQGRTMSAFENFLDDVAVSKLPEGQSLDEALTSSVNELVNIRNKGIDEAASDVMITEAGKAQIEDQLANSVMEVPALKAMLEGSDEILNSQSYYDEITKSMVGLDDQGSLLERYKEAWDDVQKAYDSVPNAPIDVQLFSDKLDEALMAAGPLDQSTGVIRGVLGDIEKVFKPKKVATEIVDDPLADPQMPAKTRDVMMSKEELFDRLGNEIGFQDLLRFKKELERRISSLPQGSDARAALQTFSRHITDANEGQLAFVANSGNTAAAQAAQKAKATFIEAKSKFDNSEPMSLFSQKAQTVTGAGFNTQVSPGGDIRGMPNLTKYATSDMPNLLMSDKSGKWMQNYVYAMGGVAKNDASLLPMRQLAEAQAKFDLVSAMRSGDQGMVDKIFDVINQNKPRLDALGSTLEADLSEAAVSLRKRENELGDALQAADLELAAAREQFEAAQNSVLESFVSKEFPDMPVSNPQEAIIMLMSDGVDGANRIQAVLDRVNTLPPEEAMAVKEAMRGAAVKGLMAETFGSTPTAMIGDRATYNTKIGRLKNVLDRRGNDFLGGLRVLYKDDPEALQGIEIALTGLMRQNLPQRIKVNQAGSDTAFNQQMMSQVSDSVSAGVLLTFGFMTPGGAMARNVARSRITELGDLAKTVGDETLTLILSDPIAFGDMVRALQKTQPNSARQALVRTFVETASHGLGYQLRISEEGEDESSLDSQMLNLAKQGESLIRDTVNQR